VRVDDHARVSSGHAKPLGRDQPLHQRLAAGDRRRLLGADAHGLLERLAGVNTVVDEVVEGLGRGLERSLPVEPGTIELLELVEGFVDCFVAAEMSSSDNSGMAASTPSWAAAAASGRPNTWSIASCTAPVIASSRSGSSTYSSYDSSPSGSTASYPSGSTATSVS
jgi:hypothetical protein